MRKIAVIIIVAIFLAGFAWSVRNKEKQLAHGRVVLLRIAPVDPRSIMQGDYMDLDFAMTNEVRGALHQRKYKEGGEEKGKPAPRTGKAVLLLDENQVGVFERLDDGTPLKENEVLIEFRRKERAVTVASGAFFFQEGLGALYERAVYAELRLDQEGRPLIAHLLDSDFKRIMAPKAGKDPNASMPEGEGP